FFNSLRGRRRAENAPFPWAIWASGPRLVVLQAGGALGRLNARLPLTMSLDETLHSQLLPKRLTSGNSATIMDQIGRAALRRLIRRVGQLYGVTPEFLGTELAHCPGHQPELSLDPSREITERNLLKANLVGRREGRFSQACPHLFFRVPRTKVH